MTIVALFKMVKKYKRHNTADDWITEMWWIHVMEYYSAIKRNKVESFVEMRMHLESIIQSELKTERERSYLIHICGI